MLVRHAPWVFFAVLVCPLAAAEPTPEQRQFQEFVRAQAAKLRAGDRVPATKEEWMARRDQIRRGLEEIWGGFPEHPCDLAPKKLGEERRDGYRFERLIFQTMPDVWMTAFAYVPDAPGPHPAILMVHGHWKGAKQDPVVQARCIGAAKLGFFVLAVDAFGAGERGLTKNLGEYHGEMVGATLFPIGRPLSGIQVYENMRAVEYLQSRPDVNPEKTGITGASGGGNQSMYAGCFDERFAAVIPCCSVGTYDAYLTTACCMCEVVPGALRLTEEGGVLGLAAPRGLMVINATKDTFVFSPGEARKSIRFAQDIFSLTGQPNYVRHNLFFWHHDYSRSMREAMYGWMTYHLKGEGDGAPIAEPELKTYDPEQIRCFPNGTRPDDWLTLPQFAAREGKRFVEHWEMPASREEWRARSVSLRTKLVKTTFGGFPQKTPSNVRASDDGSDATLLRFEPEPGIQLTAHWKHADAHPKQTWIVLNLQDGAAATCEERGNTVTLDLRATGKLAWPADQIMRAPDHNTAQWSMWIGRPLLGQWTYDVLRLIDALKEQRQHPLGEIGVIGQGPAGLVALCAAIADDDQRIQHVIADGTLGTYLSDVPYEGQRVGIMAPGIVRDVGDIPHLAALVPAASVSIRNATTPAGRPLSGAEVNELFATTLRLAKLAGRENSYSIGPAK
jgi:dienelactone hydrolase